MKHIYWISGCIVLLTAVSVSHAMPITLEPDSLTGLGVPTPMDTVTVTNMSNGSLTATVYSQAYTGGSGLYAYLYQVENTGEVSDLRAEMFTIAPFTGADGSANMGWLTGALPSGFIAATPSQLPAPNGDVYIPGGPTVSFYYSAGSGYSIEPGEHSVVMYVMSNLSPTQVSGEVMGYIGASTVVASGDVVGPVPEPATIALLGLGAVSLLRRKRKA